MNEKRPCNSAYSQMLVAINWRCVTRRGRMQVGDGKVDCFPKPRKRPPRQAINRKEPSVHRFVVRPRDPTVYDASEDR